VQFLKICISQGSVATRFGCGEIFNDSFIANCVLVKSFENRSMFSNDIDTSLLAHFFVDHGVVLSYRKMPFQSCLLSKLTSQTCTCTPCLKKTVPVLFFLITL